MPEPASQRVRRIRLRYCPMFMVLLRESHEHTDPTKNILPPKGETPGEPGVELVYRDLACRGERLGPAGPARMVDPSRSHSRCYLACGGAAWYLARMVTKTQVGKTCHQEATVGHRFAANRRTWWTRRRAPPPPPPPAPAAPVARGSQTGRKERRASSATPEPQPGDRARGRPPSELPTRGSGAQVRPCGPAVVSPRRQRTHRGRHPCRWYPGTRRPLVPWFSGSGKVVDFDFNQIKIKHTSPLQPPYPHPSQRSPGSRAPWWSRSPSTPTVSPIKATAIRGTAPAPPHGRELRHAVAFRASHAQRGSPVRPSFTLTMPFN